MAGGPRRAAPRRAAAAPSFLLAAAVLAAAAALAGAQLDSCASNPSQDICKDYVVPQAALETDLTRLCSGSALGGANYSGWPSACTLWHECQTGRAAADSCQPLALLQTACNEPGAIETDMCMTYLLLCAPGSKVQQCVDQPPIRQLKPPMQYYSAVQRLCNGTSTATGTGDAAAGSGAVANASLELDLNSEDAAAVAAACRTCSAMSDDPTKVVVQATQANCPDPLGTLSTLCLLVGDAPAANASCAGWDALCSSDAGAGFWGLCSSASPAPAPAPAAAEDDGRAAAASAPEAATGEASVKVPAAGTAGTTPAAGAPAPAPAGTGSGSSSATTSGGSSSSSSASNDAPVTFQKMYLHASMSAVILFKDWVPSSGGAYVASCLAIIALAVFVQALKALSHQTEARWEAQRRAPTFVDCSASGSPTYGHALSRSSMESQNGHEPRRSSAMSTMPMLRGMSSANARSSLSNGMDGAYAPRQQPLQFVTREELARNAQRALFTGATIFLDLMLMLVVMTFNLGLIICVTLGYMLGALAFGHLKERVPAAAYAGGAKPAPTNPLFIVGSMQPPAEEAGFDPIQLDHQRSLRQIHTQA